MLSAARSNLLYRGVLKYLYGLTCRPVSSIERKKMPRSSTKSKLAVPSRHPNLVLKHSIPIPKKSHKIAFTQSLELVFSLLSCNAFICMKSYSNDYSIQVFQFSSIQFLNLVFDLHVTYYMYCLHLLSIILKVVHI